MIGQSAGLHAPKQPALVPSQRPRLRRCEMCWNLEFREQTALACAVGMQHAWRRICASEDEPPVRACSHVVWIEVEERKEEASARVKAA